MLRNSKAEVPKEQIMALRAEELFREGYNCCESLIKSSIEILNLPLPPETYLMGKFFRLGVAESGCICGALAGGTMVLGYLAGEGKYRPELAQRFRDEFVDKFGSACCRVIRKNQAITGRFRNKKCREITGFAAGVLHSLAGSGEKGLSNG